MKIESVKKISNCKFLNLFSIHYRDRENTEKKWVFASRSSRLNPLEKNHFRPDAVVVVPYHAMVEKLVVIKEFRCPLNGYQYGFPAGLLDRGETVEQAGIRELYEETGLSVTRVLKQSPAVFSSSGMTDESVSLLFVECKGEPTTQYNEASEDIEIMLLSQKNAQDVLQDSRIKFDVKSWIVLDAFAAKGFL